MLTDTIQPGLQQIDDEVYHSLPFCSKHALDVIAERSPMHLRYQREFPEPPTDAMRFGSAFHTYVLEPDEFGPRHPVMTQCIATKAKRGRCSNPGKYYVCGGWFCGTHADEATEIRGAVTVEQFEQIQRMRDAIMRHPAAANVLNSPGDNEQAAIWDRDVTGDGWTYRARCKLKADALRPEWDAVVDIKTCESAAFDAFTKALTNFGYHRQAAYYLDGLAAVGRTFTNFILIAVEKSAPYGVAAFNVQKDAIDLGREQNERLIRTYANCERRGFWPGYEDEFRDVSLTSYAFRAAMAQV